jgi:hypothetical protein
MSSVFKQSGFKNRLSSVSMIFNSTPECREIAEKTVLKNRLTQEEKTGYRYTIEEVSLIMDYDIKVGPPREVFFDKLARLISNKLAKDSLSGIYLKPTYPLGLGFDYFIQHPEVEEYGLTPYKAGSNKLQDNRIILNKDVRRNIDGLIKNTFVPNNLDLPNPLLDLLTITDLAKSCLDKEIVLSDYQKLVKDKNVLASKLKEQLELYIYKPLEY